MPPRGVLTLVVLHATAFIIVAMMHAGEGRTLALLLSFHGADSQWPAVLTHPYVFSALQLGVVVGVILTLYVTWVLGSAIECDSGSTRLITLYAGGNLAAGIAFYALAKASPGSAIHELNMPVGALAAWAMVGWLRFDDRMVLVFGRPMSFSRAIGWAGAIVVGLAVFTGGPGSTAWTAAVVAGVGTGWLAEHLPNLRPRLTPAVRRRRRDDHTVTRSVDRPRPTPKSTPSADDIDEILAKISRSGIDSLSADERERLEAARRARLQSTQGQPHGPGE